MKKYSSEIEEIHRTVDSACTEKLTEARTILSECENKGKAIEKANRLASAGFPNTTEVKAATNLVAAAAMATRIEELILKYKIEYPLLKFITEQQVKSICEKWNLVLCDCAKFTGFVPEKNLAEIESFLKKYTFNIWADNGNMWKTKTITIDLAGYEINWKQGDSTSRFWKDGKSVFYGCEWGEYAGVFYGSAESISDRVWCDELISYKRLDNVGCLIKQEMQICAPIKDIDTTKDMKLVDGYQLRDNPPKDPIVLQPCLGGYFVVSKWGDEASDENLFDEQMN